MKEFYPEKISRYYRHTENAGTLKEPSAEGTWASFLCGVSVRFTLRIDDRTKKIKEVRFQTNGCGYVIATADFVSREIRGQELTALHGLDDLERSLKTEFGEFPADRRHCRDICLEALHNALAAYRRALTREWTGETALICSCFGVSEERIENEIEKQKLTTVEEVGAVCNAGNGCGSCQPLIQEILDSQEY